MRRAWSERQPGLEFRAAAYGQRFHALGIAGASSRRRVYTAFWGLLCPLVLSYGSGHETRYPLFHTTTGVLGGHGGVGYWFSFIYWDTREILPDGVHTTVALTWPRRVLSILSYSLPPPLRLPFPSSSLSPAIPSHPIPSRLHISPEPRAQPRQQQRRARNPARAFHRGMIQGVGETMLA